MTITNSGIALNITGTAQFTNNGTMSINICNSGILTNKNSEVINNGRMDITNLANYGIRNIASFVNNGPLVLENIGDNIDDYAISNFYVPGDIVTNAQAGYFENNFNIVMSNIKGVAINNGHSTTFLNTGIFRIEDAIVSGLTCSPESTFTITDDAFLILISAGNSPLDIHEEAIFDLQSGGSLTIRD